MDRLSEEIVIIAIGSCFFLLVAVGIIILVLVYQKKQLQYLLEKKELSNQFHKEILKTRLEAQEETLTQLSAELHDNVGQLLSSSKLLIGVAGRDIGSAAEPLRMADETISKAIRELRSLSKSINAEWLEKFSLTENLQAEADRLNALGSFTVSLSYPSDLNLSSERQILLFRMAQESLQNAVRHGKATDITIMLETEEGATHMTIVDNGCGFHVDDLRQGGVGMSNIRHRAQIMGGTAQWVSDANGTKVRVHLPA
jgi:signal transduction histidine kinase